MSTSDTTPSEKRWTDASIRWEDAENKNEDEDKPKNDDEAQFDPFADPDPRKSFSFEYKHDDNLINIELQGYKYESDQIWQSTGLTLWRASEHLCEYMLKHSVQLDNKRILELGAGLGLCGILAHRIAPINSEVFVTDGDTDALEYLRQNIQANKTAEAQTISCQQLLWGRSTSEDYLSNVGQTFEMMLASDIIYSPVIVEPLWETVQTLLSKPDGVFWLAFARRRVPITIESVLEAGVKAGFDCDCQGETDGVLLYVVTWKREAL